MALRRRWLLVFPVLALAGASLLLWQRTWEPGRAFDPVAWRDETQVRNGVRLEMADRLIARGVLPGKTRIEVVDLLGEPPPTGYFRDWDLVYWLGPERAFFSVDSEWLVLKLGENERVVDARMVRD